MDFMLLLQAILYFCILILGFLVCIPVGVNRSNFDGLCILYADFNGRRIVGSTASTCDFPIYFGVFGMIIFGLLAGLCFSYFVIKSKSDKDFGKGMWTLPFIPLNCILALITLIVACMLSVGFKMFCDDIKEHATYIKSCAQYENQPFNSEVNTGPFVGLSSCSQAGAWIGFLLYLAQTGIGVRRFIQNRRQDQQKT